MKRIFLLFGILLLLCSSRPATAQTPTAEVTDTMQAKNKVGMKISCRNKVASTAFGYNTTKVFYTPTAENFCGDKVTIVCDPASGTEFTIGKHTVTVTATDSCGNTKTSSFDVTVTDARIYVVIAVMLTILAGLIMYLIRLDRKIGRLEKEK